MESTSDTQTSKQRRQDEHCEVRLRATVRIQKDGFVLSDLLSKLLEIHFEKLPLNLFNPKSKSSHLAPIKGRGVGPVALKSSVLLSVCEVMSCSENCAAWCVIQVHIQVGPILQIRCLYVNRMVLWRRAGQLLTGKKMQNNNNKAIFGLVLHNTCRTLVLLHYSTANRDTRPPGTTAVKTITMPHILQQTTKKS